MKKAGFILIILTFLIAGLFRLHYLMQPALPVIGQQAEPVQIRIRPGSTSSEIAHLLNQHKVIRSPLVFNLILKIKDLDDNLKAGYYEIKPTDDLSDIINKLVKGKVATVKVTIPEGFTVEEIAERLAKYTPYNKNDYLNVATANKELLKLIPEANREQKYPVEGFLYPATYTIPLDFSPADTLRIMIDKFNEKWRRPLEKAASEMGFPLMDLVTIASLVEEEARLAEEKPLIAGVIYNRLEEDMFLQIDASIQYLLPARKERILYRDLKVDSPYNTYLYPGLPPGPICSPGDNSLKAAIRPKDTDYFFYFAIDNGSHVFSKTYEEHLELQKKLRDEE